MPAGTFERTSPSAAAASPASADSTPEKPRSLPESRKSSKPIMEKRRRARINESLGQLKTLILDALKKDHLRNLQRLQTAAAVNPDPSVLGKYRAGFSECLGEVTRFLSSCEGLNTEVRTRLLSHLAACVTQINAVNFYTPHPGAHRLGQTGTQTPVAPAPQMSCKSGSAMLSSPEAMKLYGGFQVVPTPDGQFAFLVPSSALMPLGAQNSPHMSPIAPPVTSDSVWRPW
ncbi:hypothetical protein KUCAC02_018237 [Chaenocephalus aceratus]|uniref:Uncharacterized protein n=1 Tax=Chaenocephalus aceratus TaxID=36190 RepID=A0ACB9W954_CHAAC|nr:hypothetical protein KUCAC02_018237 [Chaenocephalus aceratus]